MTSTTNPTRTTAKTLWAVFSGSLGVLYLLNPTAGFFELIPDTIPFVGNLDEAAATLLVMGAINYFRATRRRASALAEPGPDAQ
jgi:hypothetical protein